MLSFVKFVVGSFHISQRGTHMGFIAYSDTASISFNFEALSGAGYTVAGVNKLLDGVKQLSGNGRRIDLALQLAYQKLFTAASGARDDARKVSITLR
jgi:hypothetical protein